eukprot:CAMPEP_0119005068 /NCGR_PEP_ID=MMETSP1176-20130426/1510_1 /TAXON_ID=265551 /ORGANISM="Synedropsis recta cf, Strain CCMP1620" /LENGTH=627 /DNA_ID=CAMNT_0006956835 /DNA_START=23 /DNA_END=1906 /DNA_ORIENTATION=+
MKGLSVLLACQLSALGLGFQCLVPFSSNRLNLSITRTTLFVQEDRDVWEKELEDTKMAIGRLDALEAAVKEDDSDLEQLSEEMDQVEQEISQLSFTPLCPKGLSMEDYKLAIRAYSKQPLSLKLALYTALKMNTVDSPYPTVGQYPEIVAQLYEQRLQLTSQKLEDAMKDAQGKLKVRGSGSIALDGKNPEAEAQAILAQLLEGKSVDEVQSDNIVKQQLGRKTRKEDKCATAKDLEILMNVLDDKSFFVVRGTPEEVPGGYVVRGANRKKSSQELIEALDAKLPSEWNGAVSYMRDITNSGLDPESGNVLEEPVLVLLNKDFSPETNWIQPLSTTIAAVTTFLYGIGIYATNDNVAARLEDLSSLGDISGVDWFNGRLVDVLLPLIIIQAMHELGHFLIAQKDKIDISLPTLVPFYGKLPNLGFRTDLKTSPPNLRSLFDFAFIGPLMGIITSIIFLAYGTQMTLLADPETLEFFPALSVGDLKLSTLGVGVVDYLFGGSGVISSQDPSNMISLHPFAIAGFAGLFIQALEMMPLGSTDGGRMSQSIFGRSGHLVVGGGAWLVLLVATLFIDQSGDILLGAWIVNNISQNDMEIPCRNEVETADPFRSAAGFALWFVAVLALVPMQ